LVLITGTGRSGTSTMSGALHHLGLYVPGPYLRANESNPKGFFESSWAVRFHNRLTERAGINSFDSRPGAFERAQRAITPQARDRLERFLAEHAAVDDQVVVKDPRTVWVQKLWREAGETAGLSIRYISMLRHPAEVIGSRTTYYTGEDTTPEKRRHYEIFNVARWVNNSIISERETRGCPRAFVRYTDLLTDWRPVAKRLRDELGLRLTELDRAEHHAVDDFIDPDLRRHAVTWEELEVPAYLQEIAQGVWDALGVLADAPGGVDEAASARMDELSARFSRVLADADAINHDAGLEAVANARSAAEAEVRASIEQARADAPVEERPVGRMGGRKLLRVAAGRVRRRLRRR
jgi:hypothetical protein